MAKDVITRFKLETTQYDSALRTAAKGLSDYAKTASNAGKDFDKFTKDNIEAAKALGTMSVGATNAKDKVKELVGAYNEAAKAYESLSAEQKQADWAKAFAGSLTTLQQRIKEAKEELYGLGNTVEEVKSKSSGLFGEGGLTGMLSVAGGNLMAQGITALGSEIKDAVAQSIELARQGEGIRIAFERLNRPDLLDQLKEATHGTVSELELMKQAVKFSDFKLNLDEMGTLLAFAQQKAKDTGQSVDYMVDSIVTGLGRQSLMILDNLGLSAAQIKERMKETGDMTSAVASIIKDQMSEAGDYVETAADRAARAAAAAQNQMEELGRKAMPVAEQWASTWATIKTGALDLLNNAVTPLINALTTAGRLKAAQQDRGSQGRVDQQIAWLQNPGDEGKQNVYERITDSYVDQINHARSELNKLRKQASWNPFAAWKADKAQANLNAIKQEYEDFKAQAKPIMNPITTKVTVDTDNAVQDINTLKAKLSDLQKQRKAAISAGDTKKSKDLLKQINQTKNDIRGLDPNALRTGSGGGGTDPVKQAQEKVATAMHEHEQAIEKAKMSLENGTKTEADYKKQLLSAEERLWDALGDAYNIHKDPKYKEAQDECAKKIQQLGGEVTASVEAQKKATESARELAQTQKKVATAMEEAQIAYQGNDLKGYLSAMKKAGADPSQGMAQQIKNVTATVTIDANNTDALQKLQQIEGINIDPKTMTVTADDTEALQKLQQIEGINIDPKTVKINYEDGGFTYTGANLDAFIGNMKEQLSQADLGSTLYNNLTAQLADATALGNLMQEAVKNGIDIAQFTPQDLWKKIFGENPGDYIDDDVWKEFLNSLSKQSGKKLQLNKNTGEVREVKNNDGLEKFSKDFSAITGSVNGILSGVQNLGIEIPEGLKETIGVIQTISGILTAILAITTTIQATAASNAAASWLDALIPFARGGIVPHAANGFIPGNDHSDMTPVMVSSGELILNKAQQGNLASQLENNNRGGYESQPYLNGEMLYLGLTAYLRRAGYGEIVTANK